MLLTRVVSELYISYAHWEPILSLLDLLHYTLLHSIKAYEKCHCFPDVKKDRVICCGCG